MSISYRFLSRAPFATETMLNLNRRGQASEHLPQNGGRSVIWSIDERVKGIESTTCLFKGHLLAPSGRQAFSNRKAKCDMWYATPPVARHSAFPREIRLRRSSPREAQIMIQECLTSAIWYASTLTCQNRAADGHTEETAHIKM